MNDDVMKLLKRCGEDWVNVTHVRQRECRLKSKQPLVEDQTQWQIQLSQHTN